MSARKAKRQPKARRPILPSVRVIARNMVKQMRNTPGAVALTLKRPGSQWRAGLPDIASAAFSDAFAGFCAVYSLHNRRSTIDHMVRAFLSAMRTELEARERAELGRKGGAA